MPLSPFFISALLLCIPYVDAAFQDLNSRTVSLETWKLSLLALPTSLFGWYTWYYSGHFEYRVLLLLAGFIAAFFIGMILWRTGRPEIGGGDVLAISLMLLFVPILPELSDTLIYIFPLCLCTMFTGLYWNVQGKRTPFIFPFAICHAGLLIIATLI